LADEIEREAARRSRSWSAMAAELLEEAVRMRRAPGIVCLDGPTGRRAVVAGSGLDVWELIAAWRGVGGQYAQLRDQYHWLSDAQLRAALGYYELYPTEIDERLAREAQWTPERVRRELPFTAHPGGAS
jgi:uncharacterized protein (DUF433 family)